MLTLSLPVGCHMQSMAIWICFPGAYLTSYDILLEFWLYVHFRVEQHSEDERFWFAKPLFETILRNIGHQKHKIFRRFSVCIPTKLFFQSALCNCLQGCQYQLLMVIFLCPNSTLIKTRKRLKYELQDKTVPVSTLMVIFFCPISTLVWKNLWWDIFLALCVCVCVCMCVCVCLSVASHISKGYGSIITILQIQVCLVQGHR